MSNNDEKPPNICHVAQTTRATFVYPRAYRCQNINSFCLDRLGTGQGFNFAMRRKAETLQHNATNNNIKITKAQQYSLAARGKLNQKISWATQGVRGTNPNLQNLKIQNNSLLYNFRLNNSSQNPSAAGLPTHGYGWEPSGCQPGYELSYNTNVPLTDWIVQRTYGGGSSVPIPFGDNPTPCQPVDVALELLYPFVSYRGGGGFAPDTADYCYDSPYADCSAFYKKYHNNSLNPTFPPYIQKQINVPGGEGTDPGQCYSMPDFCGNWPIVWFAAQWREPASHGAGGTINRCRRQVTINNVSIMDPIPTKCGDENSAYYTASTTTDLWVAMPNTMALAVAPTISPDPVWHSTPCAYTPTSCAPYTIGYQVQALNPAGAGPFSDSHSFTVDKPIITNFAYEASVCSVTDFDTGYGHSNFPFIPLYLDISASWGTEKCLNQEDLFKSYMTYKVEISGHVFDTNAPPTPDNLDGSRVDVSYALNFDLSSTGQIYPNMNMNSTWESTGNPLEKNHNKIYPYFDGPPYFPAQWKQGDEGFKPEPEYPGWKVGYWKCPPFHCCIPYSIPTTPVGSGTNICDNSPTLCSQLPWDKESFPSNSYQKVPYKQNLLLLPGQIYDIKLTVINPLGWNEHIFERIYTPGGVPGEVRNLTMTNIDSSSVYISWIKPDHDGGVPILGYTIYWYQQQECYNNLLSCKDPTVFPLPDDASPLDTKSYDGSLSLPLSYFGSPPDLSYTLRDLSCGYYYHIVVDASNLPGSTGCGGEGMRKSSCVQMGINPPQPDFSFIQPAYSKGYPDWDIDPWTDISCGAIDISFTQPYDISSCINQIRLWEFTESALCITSTCTSLPLPLTVRPSPFPLPCQPAPGPPPWNFDPLPQPDPPSSSFVTSGGQSFPQCSIYSVATSGPWILCWTTSDCSKVDFVTSDYGKSHIWENAFVGDPSTWHIITIQSAMHNRWCNDGNCIPFPNTSVCNCSMGMNDLSSQTYDYSFCMLLDGSSGPPRGDSINNKISIASLDASTIDISWNKPPFPHGGQDICGYVVVLTHNAAESYTPDEPYHTSIGTHPKNFWNAMGDLSYPTNYRTSDDNYRFVTHYPYVGSGEGSSYSTPRCPGFVPAPWSPLGTYPYGLSYNYIAVADFHNNADFSYNLKATNLQCAASYRVDIYAQNDTACSNAGDEDLANFPYCNLEERTLSMTLSDYNTPNFPINPSEVAPHIPNVKTNRGWSSGISAEFQVGEQPDKPQITQYTTYADTNRLDMSWSYSASEPTPERFLLYIAGWSSEAPGTGYTPGGDWQYNPLSFADMDFSYNSLTMDRYEKGTSNGSDPDILRYYNYNAQNTNYDSPNGEYDSKTTYPSGFKSKYHTGSQPVWWLVNIFPGTDTSAINITNFSNWHYPDRSGEAYFCYSVSTNYCDGWTLPAEYSTSSSIPPCPKIAQQGGAQSPPWPTHSTILGISDEVPARYQEPPWPYGHTTKLIPNALGPPGWTGTPITVNSHSSSFTYDTCIFGGGTGVEKTYPNGFGGRWSFALVACCGNKNSNIAKTNWPGIPPWNLLKESIPDISEYVDLSWDILGPAQDTVNIFDVSLGASSHTYYQSFLIAQDPSMMFLNPYHRNLYPGGLTTGGWTGHPPCSTYLDWSGVEIGFDISYDISPILGTGSGQISHDHLSSSKWSLDIKYNNQMFENATNSYTYEDGSNQRFFWGEGIKKWNYSSVWTSGAGSDLYDTSHINFRYLDLRDNYKGTGDLPSVGFGQNNQVRIRIIDETNQHTHLSNWTNEFQFPDWVIGGDDDNVRVNNNYIENPTATLNMITRSNTATMGAGFPPLPPPSPPDPPSTPDNINLYNFDWVITPPTPLLPHDPYLYKANIWDVSWTILLSHEQEAPPPTGSIINSWNYLYKDPTQSANWHPPTQPALPPFEISAAAEVYQGKFRPTYYSSGSPPLPDDTATVDWYLNESYTTSVAGVWQIPAGVKGWYPPPKDGPEMNWKLNECQGWTQGYPTIISGHPGPGERANAHETFNFATTTQHVLDTPVGCLPLKSQDYIEDSCKNYSIIEGGGDPFISIGPSVPLGGLLYAPCSSSPAPSTEPPAPCFDWQLISYDFNTSSVINPLQFQSTKIAVNMPNSLLTVGKQSTFSPGEEIWPPRLFDGANGGSTSYPFPGSPGSATPQFGQHLPICRGVRHHLITYIGTQEVLLQ